MARALLLLGRRLLRSPTTGRLPPSSSPGYVSSMFDSQPLAETAEVNMQRFHLEAFQKRWASQATARLDDSKISIGPQGGRDHEEKNNDTSVVYYGPISSTIKKVKMLSLSTCCLSVSLGPVVTFMTSPEMNVILKGAVASTVMILSATTTAALHWFVSPYVHKLKWQPGSDSVEVEKMSWLATYVPETIKFADVRPPNTNRPYVTFKANGMFYYVDPDHLHNKALLARLTAEKPPHESAFKNL